jgi:hypothetical protein
MDKICSEKCKNFHTGRRPWLHFECKLGVIKNGEKYYRPVKLGQHCSDFRSKGATN